MKNIFAVLILSLLILGCSEDNSITIGVEKGYDCPENVINSIESYYGSENIVFKEAARSEVGDDKFDVSLGAVEMGRAIGYGVWKNNVMGYDNACCVSYDDYKMSTDFSGKKVGIEENFNYSNYISFDEDCDYSSYNSSESMLSDLKEGIIDAIVCSPNTAEMLKSSDNNLRVNDLLDSNIYEYVVVSKDIELINSLDKVIEWENYLF